MSQMFLQWREAPGISEALWVLGPLLAASRVFSGGFHPGGSVCGRGWFLDWQASV